MNTYANSTKEEECWSPYDEYIQEILAIKKEKRAFGLNLFNQIILNQKNKTLTFIGNCDKHHITKIINN